MFDIYYCDIENCNDWNCEKSDNCKRNLQRKDIPAEIPYGTAHLFNICKDKDYHMFIPYGTEVKKC